MRQNGRGGIRLGAIRVYQPPDDAGEEPPKRKHCRTSLPEYLPWPAALALLDLCAKQIAAATCPSKLLARRTDNAMVRLGVYCGLRSCELVKLNVENVNFEERKLFVSKSKGGKDRYVPVPRDPAKVLDVLRDYIGERRLGPLFSNKRGERFCDRTIRFRLDRLCKLAEFAKLHPHMLRHTAATRLLQTGADIREVQTFLGHVRLETTAIYTHVEISRLNAAVDRM